MNTRIVKIPRQGSPESRAADESRIAALAETIRRRHQEWLLDEALAETFPASDPISTSVIN
jgi:hypothetical protein